MKEVFQNLESAISQYTFYEEKIKATAVHKTLDNYFSRK